MHKNKLYYMLNINVRSSFKSHDTYYNKMRNYFFNVPKIFYVSDSHRIPKIFIIVIKEIKTILTQKFYVKMLLLI